MERDDAYYVNRCLAGDQDAFGELVRRYQHAAYGLALSQVRQFADAQDLAQEAFLAAYQDLHSLQDPARFGPWLRSTVVNLCRNWRRGRQRTARATDELGCEMTDRQAESPETLCESADLHSRVLEAIGRLPANQRETVVLYYLDGLTSPAIGAFLGVSANAVDQRLHRARAQLKEEMMKMVEGVLKTSQPQDFPERVLEEIARRARAALEGQDRVAAVQHFDEALARLESLEASESQKRWRAAMLWERSRAAYFLEDDPRERVIQDVEVSLQLERELGPRQRYAQRLVDLGLDYSNSRQYEKALAVFREAATLFAELGDANGQAWAVFWVGRHLIPWLSTGRGIPGADCGRALELFQQAADLFYRGGDRLGQAQAQAAADLMGTLGPEPQPPATDNVGAKALAMERTVEVLRHQAGSGFSESRPGAPSTVFSYMVRASEWLRFPLEAGASWVCPAFAYGTETMRATNRVTRLDAEADTPAGVFRNCLELETTLERSGEDPNESYRRLNTANSGVRLAWFAPGVGLVRLHYRHGDGGESKAVLTRFTVPGTSDEYLPLEPGVVWSHEVTNTTSDYVIRDHSQVTRRDGKAACIAGYYYSDRR